MAFSFIALATGLSDASGTTLDTSASLNVQAGDLLVAWVKFEGGTSTTIAVAKNSGSPSNAFTFDAGDAILHGNNDLYTSFGYLLSAAVDATATFRVTLGAARSFRRLMVAQFRPTSGYTVTKDGSNRASGSSGALASGNITTTGSDAVAVGAYGEYSANGTSSEQIGGVGATEPTGSPIAGGVTSLWYRLLTGTMTGGASATITSQPWTCAVIAFKQEPGKPQLQAVGTIASGVTDVTVNWPTHQAGDVGILVVETADEAVVLGTPAGFVEIQDSPQAGTAPLLVNRTRLTAFWCRATSGSMTSPVITDPGDHAVAYIVTFRGVRPTGNPWNVTKGDAVTGTGDTVVAVPGSSTTQPDCLIVSIVAYKQQGPNISGWANADLANVAQIADLGAADGNAGAVAMASGEKALAGAFGATTATLSTQSQQGRLMLALAPYTATLPPTPPADIYLYQGES